MSSSESTLKTALSELHKSLPNTSSSDWKAVSRQPDDISTWCDGCESEQLVDVCWKRNAIASRKLPPVELGMVPLSHNWLLHPSSITAISALLDPHRWPFHLFDITSFTLEPQLDAPGVPSEPTIYARDENFIDAAKCFQVFKGKKHFADEFATVTKYELVAIVVECLQLGAMINVNVEASQ